MFFQQLKPVHVRHVDVRHDLKFELAGLEQASRDCGGPSRFLGSLVKSASLHSEGALTMPAPRGTSSSNGMNRGLRSLLPPCTGLLRVL